MRALVIALGASASVCALAQRKDAASPAFVAVEASRLAFHVSPPSATPVEAVDALLKLAGKARIQQVRAFIAASEDAEPVAGGIAKRFAGKRVPVPVIAVIRAARFIDPRARVTLESVEEAADARNPAGLAFISGQATQAPFDANGPKIALTPLAVKSVASLRSALSGLNLVPEDVLRVTCFTSSMEDGVKVHGLVAAAFIHAAIDLMQAASAPDNSVVECEAVARLKYKPPDPVQLVNPTGAAFAQAALVSPGKLVLTSAEPGVDPGDAFKRIAEILAAAGTSLGRVFYAYAYPAGPRVLQIYRDARWNFLDRTRAPASTNLPFDGISAPGAAIGIQVIAAGR
jgi:enamine deaminase RidA (YjgF/YER057c/UK114 family)